MKQNDLYPILTRFGDYYPLNLHSSLDLNKLEIYNWIQYNPNKNINREALSITSLKGDMSGIPDLDSLYEYYKKTGIAHTENDFTAKTEIYKYFSEVLDPLEKYIGRTHIIRLNNGGYFPPHRDNKHFDIHSFRLFLPVTYDTSNNFFILENTKLEFQQNRLYFIDTALTHTVFNTNHDPWYFVVVNVNLTEDSVKDTLKYIIG